MKFRIKPQRIFFWILTFSSWLSSAQTHYTFLEGRIEKFGIERCAEAVAEFGNCFGANPSTPYLIPVYEAHPNEYVDPNYPELMSVYEGQKVFRGPTRFHKTEARVLILEMPERAAYFGYQHYLFSKVGEPYSGFLSSRLPDPYHPNPKRTMILNSLSNSINHQVIAKQLGQEPWGAKTMAFISGADEQTIVDAYKLLLANGFNSKNIVIETMGLNHKMGLGEAANDYLALIRYSLPEKESSKKFYDSPKYFTFRMIAKNRSNIKPLQPDVLDKRTAQDESSYKNSLDELSDSILSSLKLKNVQEPLIIAPINLGIDTYDGDDHNINCLAETRDTDTYLVSLPFKLQSHEVLVLVGTNHNRIGNSTYFSTIFTDDQEIRAGELKDSQGNRLYSLAQVGKAAGFNEDHREKKLDGSAERVQKKLGFKMSPELQTNIKNLWAQVIVRDKNLCKGIKDCLVLSKDRNTGVATNRELKLMRRVYMRPGTQRGPNHRKILKPVLSKGHY